MDLISDNEVEIEMENYNNIDCDEFYQPKQRAAKRAKADNASHLRCTSMICVLENPGNIQNIASTIRNINALGIAKLYIVDGANIVAENTWQEMRKNKQLMRLSATAIKWTYVRKFKTSKDCIDHLCKNNFVSIATSPHVKGHVNVNLKNCGKCFTEIKKIAVWFGNESEGISEYAVINCKFCVQIPMCGIIESLNLSVCVGLVLYEISNHRRSYKKANVIKDEKIIIRNFLS
jgi:tRNA (guanosine-2'-O-)-methyltransferase